MTKVINGNIGGTRKQTVDILREWKQTLGGKAKSKVVIDVLRRMKFNEAADSVLHVSQANEHSEKFG